MSGAFPYPRANRRRSHCRARSRRLRLHQQLDSQQVLRPRQQEQRNARPHRKGFGQLGRRGVCHDDDPAPQHAIQMADPILANDGIGGQVVTLTEQIETAQDPEIQTMKGWLEELGIKYDGFLSGHE
ncbi:DUF305 domain-containing protein [Rhodococcus sp. (in: high G+C Gram-positive bacteria)]|uniref:DUF305 domain-containing protein n=1 Tax=Rhodococcus sp. TaxID=1831 RepID=UPI00338F8A46